MKDSDIYKLQELWPFFNKEYHPYGQAHAMYTVF